MIKKKKTVIYEEKTFYKMIVWKYLKGLIYGLLMGFTLGMILMIKLLGY